MVFGIQQCNQDVDRMANSINPSQAAPIGAVSLRSAPFAPIGSASSGSALFAPIGAVSPALFAPIGASHLGLHHLLL